MNSFLHNCIIMSYFIHNLLLLQCWCISNLQHSFLGESVPSQPQIPVLGCHLRVRCDVILMFFLLTTIIKKGYSSLSVSSYLSCHWPPSTKHFPHRAAYIKLQRLSFVCENLYLRSFLKPFANTVTVKVTQIIIALFHNI